MSLFVYITQQCKEDAGTHGYTETLNSIKEKVEAAQNIAMWNITFPPPYLVKKKFGARQGRLIAARCDLKVDNVEHTVIVFLAIIIRGNRNYGDFYKNATEYGNNHFQPILDNLNLEAIVRERTYENPPQEKPDLKPNEMFYLKDPDSSNSTADDVFICETKEWVESIDRHKLEDLDILEIRDKLEDLYGKALNGDLKGKGSCDLPCGKQIHFEWDDKNRQITLLFLQGDKEDDCGTETSHSVFRKYPAYLTLDDRFFCGLEKDTYGNLALSEEEQKILNPKEKPLTFPMFVNGRAGSGKSTILQYLFAKFYAKYIICERPFKNPPAYFACNEELIRKATQFVSGILKNNPLYNENDLIKKTLDSTEFQGSFKVFRTYLMSLLTRNELINLFPKDKYVDYARFVKLWEEKFGRTRDARKNYGPDISWHIIRTFIKGMSADGEMEIDEFDLLPKNQKTVSKELFLNVFDKVWDGWYKVIADRETGEGFWDDQDLVSFLLEKGRFDSEEAKFPGIFCDEAQDFTQIEIIAFFKMSVFSERKIFPFQLARLPFAFAGDEFQTLNPTGFSWDAVTGMFHEKFIRALCPSAKKVELVAKDLKNNYRSLSEIVRFSNSIQLLRSVRFNKNNIEPQNMWSSDQGTPVAYYDKNDDMFWETLKERKEIQLIVPCHAGEEEDYINNDPILIKNVHKDPVTLALTPNVLSTVKAKGLEYPCVAVYGFGEWLQDESLIKNEHKWSDDARMTMEYFLNRLYVAVSRPKNQLYLVDSAEGIKRLWDFAKSSDELKRLISQSKLQNEWASKTTYWVQGMPNMLERKYKRDYVQLAKETKDYAEAQNDSTQMFKAAEYYEYAGKTQDSCRCKAKGFQMRGELSKAAQLYKNYKEYHNAGDCYWEISDWKNMAELQNYIHVYDDLRYVVAITLNGEDNKDAISNVLAKVSSKIEQNIGEYQSKPWRIAITTLGQRSLDATGDLLLKNIKTIIKLGEQGFAGVAEDAAKKAMSGRFYNEAIKLFEQTGKKSGKDYKIAVAHTTMYPEKLEKFSELGEYYYKDIVNEYDGQNQTGLFTESQKLVVARALLHLDRKEDFTKVVRSMGDYKLISQIKANKGRKRDDAMLSTFILHLSEIRKAQAIGDSDTPEYVAELVTRLKNEVRFVICVLARCHGIATDDTQNKVHQFISNFVDVWKANKDNIRKDISIVEAGCAVEKFGLMKAAMDFYETAEKDSSDLFIKERIFAVRRKRLEYHKKDKREQQYKDELENLHNDVKSIGKKLDDIPEFPCDVEWQELEDKITHLFLNYNRSKDLVQASIISTPSTLDISQAKSNTTPYETPSVVEISPKEKCDFKIGDNNKYQVEWIPKKQRVLVTVKDETSENDGSFWTITVDGVRDEDGAMIAFFDSEGSIPLLGTTLSVAVCTSGEKHSVGLVSSETGITYVFPIYLRK